MHQKCPFVDHVVYICCHCIRTPLILPALSGQPQVYGYDDLQMLQARIPLVR